MYTKKITGVFEYWAARFGYTYYKKTLFIRKCNSLHNEADNPATTAILINQIYKF